MGSKRLKSKLKKRRSHTEDALKAWFSKLSGEDILNLTAAGISAYAGYRAAKRVGANDIQAVGASGSGIIAYQLAKSMNVIAGGAGTAYLASLGLISIWDPIAEAATKVGEEVIGRSCGWLGGISPEEFMEKYYKYWRDNGLPPPI